MTTIATDGLSMAGDGQAQDHFNTIVTHSRQKVRRLSDQSIVGCCGNSFDSDAYLEWLQAGKDGDCPVESDQFAALILKPDGLILWVDHKGREIEVEAPSAIGSGQDYAIGAMEAGADPWLAVTIACRRDPGSGGEITVKNHAAVREVA